MNKMDPFNNRLQDLLGGPNVWQEPSVSTPIRDLVDPTFAAEMMWENSPPKRPVFKSNNAPAGPFRTKPATIYKKATFADTGLRKGDQDDKSTNFVPWKLVKSYPHAFIGKANQSRCRRFFSAEALHRNQPWDLYYIYNSHSMKQPTPLVMVPTYQFENHLEHINSVLATRLCIPEGKNAERFNEGFGIGGSPVPRFLGRSTTAGTLDALKKNVPGFNVADNIRHLPTQVQEDFLAQLARLNDSSKYSTKQKSEKRRVKRYENHILWGRSLKRSQRYMGLRKRKELNITGLSLSDPLPEEGGFPGKTVVSEFIGLCEPEGSVIFVSIDIEAYEFNQDIITEVGLSIFDTLDIGGQQPGSIGEKWFSLIDAFHLRIKENSWAENSKHVKGCADKFDFGTTSFVKKADIANVILSIIENAAHANSTKSRPVVLVFHDKVSDLSYLEKLRIKADKDIKGLLETMDTREIYQHCTKAMNPTKLETVLANLGIPYRYLHNAGNDALYTMRALIALAVQQRQRSRKRAAGLDAPNNRLASTKPEENEGWDTGGEDSDGGDLGDPIREIPSRASVMSWSSPANPPTKTTAAPKAHLVHENPKERHHSYVMEFDTTDEEVGEAW